MAEAVVVVAVVLVAEVVAEVNPFQSLIKRNIKSRANCTAFEYQG